MSGSVNVELARAQQKLGLGLETIARLMRVEPSDLDIALWNAMPGNARVTGPMKRIAIRAAADHCMTLDAMLVQYQSRSLVRARRHAMKQMALAGYSNAAIARFFGQHPSQVTRSVRKAGAA